MKNRLTKKTRFLFLNSWFLSYFVQLVYFDGSEIINLTWDTKVWYLKKFIVRRLVSQLFQSIIVLSQITLICWVFLYVSPLKEYPVGYLKSVYNVLFKSQRNGIKVTFMETWTRGTFIFRKKSTKFLAQFRPNRLGIDWSDSHRPRSNVGEKEGSVGVRGGRGGRLGVGGKGRGRVRSAELSVEALRSADQKVATG